MDIFNPCENKQESDFEIQSLISEILSSIIDQISVSQIKYGIDIGKQEMEIECENTSSDSSSISDEEMNYKANFPVFEDSDDGNENPHEKFLTKNERKPKPPIQDESKEEREKRYGICSESSELQSQKTIGIIQSFFENTIVIKPYIKEVLDLDNIILVKNEILGKIDDVFGNIENPLYSIIADSYITKKFNEKAIAIRDEVFVIEKQAKIILQSSINEIKKKGGCDASNMFDEEICNDKEIEFSDDEKEAKAKSKKKPHPEKERKEMPQNHHFGKEKKYQEKKFSNLNNSKNFHARENFINRDYISNFQYQQQNPFNNNQFFNNPYNNYQYPSGYQNMQNQNTNYKNYFNDGYQYNNNMPYPPRNMSNKNNFGGKNIYYPNNFQ